MKLTLDALKESVAALFEKSQDPETIKRYAVVESELDKVQKGLDQQAEQEMKLLKDLREAYLHTSVKPSENTNVNKDIGGASDFNGDSFLKNFINTHNADGKKLEEK